MLGRYIEECTPKINERKKLGYWESNSVIGSKSNKYELFSSWLNERQKNPGWFLSFGKLRKLVYLLWNGFIINILSLGWYIQDNYHEQRFRSRKTIKPEFLNKTLIYFAYPYSSCEKEPVEQHNGQIRRFIPEGKRLTATVRSKYVGLKFGAITFPVDSRLQNTVCLFEENLDKLYNFAFWVCQHKQWDPSRHPPFRASLGNLIARIALYKSHLEGT